MLTTTTTTSTGLYSIDINQRSSKEFIPDPEIVYVFNSKKKEARKTLDE